MNCFEIQEKIIDMVLGNLSPHDQMLINEHLKICSMCRDELQFLDECLKTCSLVSTESCECHFEETYWENFVVSVHDRISYEKPEAVFPFKVVLPIAASALLAAALGYFVLFRPKPQETVRHGERTYYEYDPYDEIPELSPEETEDFIELINQRYGE
jgi:predicted amidophosphoribosyltransferase